MRARYEHVPSAPGRSFRFDERRMARFDAPWHFHPEIELTHIVEGAGRRFVGDSSETFAAGDLVLLGSNLPHYWHSEARRDGRRERAHSVVVQFRPDFLGRELWSRPEFAPVRRLLQRADRGLHFRGAPAQAVAARLRTIGGKDGAAAVLELLAVLDRLARMRGRPLASAAYEPSLGQRAEDRLARIYAFLMEHYREPLTLAEIARVAAMTPPALSRYFKRATGRNVSVFLNELRIDHAAQLVRESPQGISAIAAAAGFATLSNFNRRFRERLGCSPREYRRVFAEESTRLTALRFEAAE